MAQAPATAKWKRLAMLASARVAPALAQRLSPAPSERAALLARRRSIVAPDAPTVIFLIPLVGPHHVSDWEGVGARLGRTLQGFQRQTSPNWRVVVCGQVEPPGLPDDARIRWLPFTSPVEGNDKWRKLATLAADLPRNDVPRGYAMPFDADDILAPDVVAQMVRGRARGGYLVERGYVQDAASGQWAETRPQSLASPGQKAFWKLCGSCAAFAFDFTQTPDDAALIGAITAHEHRMFPYLARLAGRPLTPLAPGAVLYILNHGENFGARRGRVSFKTRYVTRFALNDPQREAGLARTFGIGVS